MTDYVRPVIQTTFPAMPVLFYDFNTPPDEDGLYHAIPEQWDLRIGQRVVLDASSDDLARQCEVVSEYIGPTGSRIVRCRPVGDFYWPSTRETV